MKNIITYLLLFFLTACSASPGNTEVEELFMDSMGASRNLENFSIEKFERINGYQAEAGGYIVEVKYDIIYKKSLQELAQVAKSQSDGSWIANQRNEFGLNLLRQEAGDFQAGRRITRNTKLALVKTEKGWRVKDS